MDASFNFTCGNVEDFFSIFDEVIAWRAATDQPMRQWAGIDRGALVESVGTEAFIVLKYGSDNAAGMILQWVDPVFWPDAKPYEAGYIHKLCVSRKYAGMGLSTKMIDYSIEQCKRQQVPFLRLDTGADRPKLRALYERHGFTLTGFVEINGRKNCLYELPVK